MEAKNNDRLKEIRLAFYLNSIDKIQDKTTYLNMMKLLNAVVCGFGEEYKDIFINIWQKSIADGLMAATRKETFATIKTFFTTAEACDMLKISRTTFYRRYTDLINRDFITNKFLEELQPMFTEEKEKFVINVLLKFIDVFKFEIGNDVNKLINNNRTLEIEFWLIYDILLNMYRSVGVCDNILKNVCESFDIEFSTINHLKNNLFIIDRSYPHFRYNNRYFMQELVYLYSEKGLNRYEIATNILKKDKSFLYRGTNTKYCDLIGSDEADWQYAPTIEWKNLNKQSVKLFIDIFHSFIKLNE